MPILVHSLFFLFECRLGGGGVLNVRRTVKQLIKAGCKGCCIEDQVWPKMGGHLRGKEVISMEEHASKVSLFTLSEIGRWKLDLCSCRCDWRCRFLSHCTNRRSWHFRETWSRRGHHSSQSLYCCSMLSLLFNFFRKPEPMQAS